ncbi:MAG: hypothetical protein ACT4OX_02045 [Actinomycetota bacterium]
MAALSDRAALAFSAIPVTGAVRVSERLSISERVRLRECLGRNRDATGDERREALVALVAAVRAGVAFPAPLAHDEDHCPFRDLEGHPPGALAAAMTRFVSSQPLLASVALCHFSADVRDAVWGSLGAEHRAAIRPSLAHVPQTSHSRTRRFAQDLDTELRRVERRERRV